MADLLSWIITHSLALGVGIVVGAGSLGGAQLAWNRVRKGQWLGSPAADTEKK